MEQRNDLEVERQDRRSYRQSWCPWTRAPEFWGIALVILGAGLIIAEVFEIERFWDIAGGLLIAAVGISLLRAPFRRR